MNATTETDSEDKWMELYETTVNSLLSSDLLSSWGLFCEEAEESGMWNIWDYGDGNLLLQ